jgi:hypothetical protein
MTSITGIGGANMRCGFTGGNGTIMTARTNTNDFVVIYRGRRYRNPSRWEHGMTRITHIAGINMSPALTTGGGAIVTANTITGESTVIYCGNLKPIANDMAVITF